MPSMSRGRFLQEYELIVDQEFSVAGKPAEWASSTSSGPKSWGEEDDRLDLQHENLDPEKHHTACMAVTPDEKILAVATDAVIRTYDIKSKTMLAELHGHADNVGKMWFESARQARREDAEYLLLSDSRSRSGKVDTLIVWRLDAEGKQIDAPTPLAVDELASRAVAAISPDLQNQHNLSEEALKTIRDGFARTLQHAELQVRAGNLEILPGHFPSFNSQPFSQDGRVIYITHGETTQHGMRPPSELPQLVIYSLAESKELRRLQGHEDAIMWAGWSSDERHIASASWDQTFRLWDAETGECKHVIGPTGGQNWTGAFSPDGTKVLFSGTGRPPKTGIYNVEDGKEVVTIPAREGLDAWLRYWAWSARDGGLAFINESSVLLWQPDLNTLSTDEAKQKETGTDDKLEEIFSLARGEDSMLRRFARLLSIRWVDEDKKLVVQLSDGTIFVWDRQDNVKWRFQRPHGKALDFSDGGLGWLDGAHTLLSLDGDRKVRFWEL